MTVPPEVVVWKFGGKSGNVASQNSYSTNSGYNMFCTMNNKYLTYGSETIGINIVWASSGTDKKVHFHLPGNAQRPILTGEAIAFGLGGGDQWLYYHHRTMGINLDWNSNPVFEWCLIGADGVKGQPVTEGGSYALLNKKVEPNPDFMIYLDRIPGQADIGWTTSPNWPGKILGNVNQYKEAALFVAAFF